MRVLAGFIPVLAALASVADAQETDPNKVFETLPAPTAVKPTTSKPVNRAAMATSIVSSMKSSLEASKKAAATSTAKVSTKVTTKKTTTTTKKPASTKKTTKAPVKKPTTVKKPGKTTTKKPTSTKKKIGKRQTTKTTSSVAQVCTNKEPNYMNYIPSPNTPAGFIQDNGLVNTSLSQWLPPAGYSTQFLGQVGASFQDGYLQTIQLGSYDPSACGPLCDARSDCNAFNIYFQRQPLYTPNNLTCTNPEARVITHCVLYSSYITADKAINYGQARNDFLVVITGSNGYWQNPAPIRATNFTYPKAFTGAINGLSSTYSIGYYFWAAPAAYDVNRCANMCTAYTAQQRGWAVGNKTTTYKPCNYFNTVNLTYSGTYQGMYCMLYNDDAVTSTGVFTYLQSTSNGVTYTYNMTYSYGHALYPQDTGLVNTTWVGAPINTTATCPALTKSGGTTVIDLNKVNYTIACAYDVQYSNDIGNTTNILDFYMCFDLCDNFAGCNGFAYNWNTCFFKNLTGLTRTPQPNTYGTDFAWQPAKYAGFDAGKVAATITYTTYTTAWTGAATSTTTSFNGLTGYVIVQTPGAKTTAATTSSGQTVYVTTVTDSGTATAISTTTSAATSGTATVKIFYPTPPTTCSNAGVEYALYSNKWPGGQNTNGYPIYTPQAYKTSTPSASGSATYMGEYNDAGATITAYGARTTGDNLVIAHTFYVFAGRGTGYYNFQIPYTDDLQFVWVGDKAVSGWNRTNSDIYQFWPNTNAVTIAFYLTFGTYTPVRIHWANGGGIGSMQFNLFAPDSSLLATTNANTNTGTLSPHIVQNPCDSSKGAAFPAWGKET